MSQYKKYEYVLDAIGIRPHSFYAASIVLAVLLVIGIIGIIAQAYSDEELARNLALFYQLGHPVAFLILWSIMSIDVAVNIKTISFRLCDIHNTNPQLRILFYMMFSTMSLGFGLIFGTVGLFATANGGFDNYLMTLGSGILFVSVSGIIARGYICDSPIAYFFTTKAVAKFPKLGQMF